MQAIRPEHLTDEEVLRQVYLMGNEMLPRVWVEELCKRLAQQLDKEPEEIEAYENGFEEGFAAGVEHAEEQTDDESYQKGFAAGVAAANQ